MRKIWRRAKKKQEKKFRTNQYINCPSVFVIDENGKQIGVMATNKALVSAREAGFDLVEVNPKADPPVVKIIDYGKMQYAREKQIHKQKVQQKKVDVKGIRLSVRISSHDLNFRIEQAKKFLEKGHKLKIELILRGREKQHVNKAIEIINNFISTLEKIEELNIVREQSLTRQGGRFNIILINKK